MSNSRNRTPPSDPTADLPALSAITQDPAAFFNTLLASLAVPPAATGPDSTAHDMPAAPPSTSASAALSSRSVHDTPATNPTSPTLADVADSMRALDPGARQCEPWRLPQHHQERPEHANLNAPLLNSS